MLSTLRLTKINLYKHLGSVNFWTPFLIAAAAAYEFAQSLAKMAAHYSTPVNGFAAAFLTTELYTVFILFIGIFILFSDLPFKDNQQMFLLSRSGKRTWIFSQVLYVIFVSAMYFTFVFAVFCTVLIPRLSFDPQNWGKIVKTIAATNAKQEFGLKLSTVPTFIEDYAPLEALLFSFGTAILIAVILGLIVLLFNLSVKHSSGIVISGAVIFYYMFCDYHHNGYLMFYFSPLHWCSINLADKYGISPYPDVSWIMTVLCILLAAEIIALFISGSKKVKFVLDTKEEVK